MCKDLADPAQRWQNAFRGNRFRSRCYRSVGRVFDLGIEPEPDSG
jgi:hypothetical protein